MMKVKPGPTNITWKIWRRMKEAFLIPASCWDLIAWYISLTPFTCQTIRNPSNMLRLTRIKYRGIRYGEDGCGRVWLNRCFVRGLGKNRVANSFALWCIPGSGDSLTVLWFFCYKYHRTWLSRRSAPSPNWYESQFLLCWDMSLFPVDLQQCFELEVPECVSASQN